MPGSGRPGRRQVARVAQVAQVAQVAGQNGRRGACRQNTAKHARVRSPGSGRQRVAQVAEVAEVAGQNGRRGACRQNMPGSARLNMPGSARLARLAGKTCLGQLACSPGGCRRAALIAENMPGAGHCGHCPKTCLVQVAGAPAYRAGDWSHPATAPQ